MSDLVSGSVGVSLDTAHVYAVSGVSECRAVSSVGVSSSVGRVGRVGRVGCRGVGRCVAVSGGVGQRPGNRLNITQNSLNSLKS